MMIDKLMLALRCLLKLQSLDYPRVGLLAYRVWKLGIDHPKSHLYSYGTTK